VPRVGTHSMGRLPAACHSERGVRGTLTFSTYTPIRQVSLVLTSLKPEAARSLFPRLIDCNHHFWRLLSEPDSTPLRISTRRRISSVSCASEAFLAGAVQSMHQLAGGEDARCVICFDRIRTRASSAASSPENFPLAAGQRTGRPSSRCNEPLSP
jgi:hypothetical protein